MRVYRFARFSAPGLRLGIAVRKLKQIRLRMSEPWQFGDLFPYTKG